MGTAAQSMRGWWGLLYSSQVRRHHWVSRSREGGGQAAMILCARVSMPGPRTSASPHWSVKKEQLFQGLGWKAEGMVLQQCSRQGKGPDLLLRPLSHLMGPLIMNVSLKCILFIPNKNVTLILYVSRIRIHNFITFTCFTWNKTLNCLQIQTHENLSGT